MENAIDANGSYISHFIMQNIKMSPYALKMALKLLLFLKKILQKFFWTKCSHFKTFFRNSVCLQNSKNAPKAQDLMVEKDSK